MRLNNLITFFYRMGFGYAIFFNIGCTSTTNYIQQSTQNTQSVKTTNSNDFAMLKAADFMNKGQFLEAAKIYNAIYKQTTDIYFLKQVALAKSQAGDIESAAQIALQYQNISKDVDDRDTNLIIAEDHIRKKQYNLAIILLEKIIVTNPTLQTHYILSNLYMQEHMFDKALQHFIAIYNDETSVGTRLKLEAFNKIVSIYLQNKDRDNALKYLNEYIVGGEFTIELEKLFAIYAKVNKLNMLAESLKNRFIKEQNIENARMVVSLFVQLKHYEEAISLLNDYKSSLGSDGEEMLMQVYAEIKNYSQAAKLAKQIYKDTNRIEMLGLSAVYEYEATTKKDKNTLQSIISSLKNMLTIRSQELYQANEKLTQNDAFFYNFLGYLMIDHDINIDEGMQYVSVALSINPTSFEYLDSLAWGFYKKGDCKQAKETFRLIATEKIQETPELIEHNVAIKACK